MTERLCALVLAAGAGQRMGYLPKCLIQANGQPLLHRLLQAVNRLAPQSTALVTGPHAEAIAASLAQAPPVSGLVQVHNPSPAATPADSLRLGLQALAPLQADATLIVLADLPLITAEDLTQVLCAYRQRKPGQEVLWPSVHGVPGHPIVISRTVAEALVSAEQLTLKRWRQRHPDAVADWESANDHLVRDLDTPEDLQRLRQDTGMEWSLPVLAP